MPGTPAWAAARRRLILTVGEAAEATGFAPITVYKAVERGALPAVRIGRAVRIPVSALRDWATDHGRSLALPDGPEPDVPAVLTLRELAQLLGVSQGTIYRAARAGTIPPSARAGRGAGPYLVIRDEVEDWIDRIAKGDDDGRV